MDNLKKSPPEESPFDKKAAIRADEDSDIKYRKNVPEEDRRPDSIPAEELKYDFIPHEKASSSRGVDNNRRAAEKRSYSRKPCFLPVDYATPDRAYQEFIQDISNSGAFVETRHLLPVGQNISITFSLPGSQRNIKMRGSVARTTPQGIGIAFVLESDEQAEYMRSYIPEV